MKRLTFLLSAFAAASTLACGEAGPDTAALVLEESGPVVRADAGVTSGSGLGSTGLGSLVCEYSGAFYTETLSGWNYGRTLAASGAMARIEVLTHDQQAVPLATISGNYNFNHTCLSSALEPIPFSARLDGNRMVDIVWNDPRIVTFEAVFDTSSQGQATGEILGLLELQDCETLRPSAPGGSGTDVVPQTDLSFGIWCDNPWDGTTDPGSIP